MAIGQIEPADQKCNVEPVGAQLYDRVARRSFDHFNADGGMVRSVSRHQMVEKAAGDEAMNTHAQAAAISRRGQAGGFYSMVEMVDAGCDALDKMPASFGQSNAARVALE
ncbi:hypothetical protein SAMIE_1035250 [Sphingobium amiense]|uniref:Uncharacterized protein n=1 Tax=Sphingobium amiense TaxID=135719 RepID=A0A494W622_9SPHN|nr:hypothetical protein SAMIE_1035250 [Sphingobium amiense]